MFVETEEGKKREAEAKQKAAKAAPPEENRPDLPKHCCIGTDPYRVQPAKSGRKKRR